MPTSRLLAFTFFLLMSCVAQAAGLRTVQPLSEGWRFTKGDPVGAERPGFDDSQWRRVTVPHDYSIEGPVAQDNPSGPAGGFFPGGVGWYRRTLTLPKLAPERRLFVVFDGVMANSDVWINGKPLGHRPSGYTSFVYDLTPYLKAGDNVIAVRCDNANEPLLRWYLGAGIYRQVRLVETADTRIVPWGSFVTTPALTAQAAQVRVRSTVTSLDQAPLALAVRLLDPDGKEVARAAGPARTVAAGATLDLEADLRLPQPRRWDVAHPSMYTARITLLRGGKPVDEEEVPFGVRSFRFDPAAGFFLNDRPLKLLGVGLHSDGGAFGAAVPLAVWQRRLAALRALGVNAIRTAHNAAAPEFLDLCDRMGFLVMDEFFDQWTLPKVPYDYSLHFGEWAARDTADTVRRDRNHPSIVLYSAGNEIRDTTKPELAKSVLAMLLKVYRENDPSRPVTQALFRPNVSHDYDNGYADMLDVVGQNYRENEILAAHAQNPARRIVGTENTHIASVWVALRDHPEYAGQFLWTGVDYLGEAGRWPVIGTGSGLLLTTSLPRPRAWERQSWWTEAPMVRLARRVAQGTANVIEPVFAAKGANAVQPAQAAPGAPSRFQQPLVADWSPTRRDDHVETVEVYTNCDEVIVTLNGREVGRERRHGDASAIRLQVPFESGELRAEALRDGKVVASDVLRTAGHPARLQLSLETAQPALRKDFDDVAHLIVTLVDANGVRVPSNDAVVSFTTAGDGVIAAVDNGNLQDHDPYQATRRRFYDGNALALVRATAERGSIAVTASVEELPPASLTIPVAPGAPLVPLRSF